MYVAEVPREHKPLITCSSSLESVKAQRSYEMELMTTCI